MQNLIGSVIGRYKILVEISHDEITGVYTARDTNLDRLVTLKLMLRSGEYSERFKEQFLGEARSLARLSHPNIVKLLDFGYDTGYLYMVTEAITGQDLAHTITGKMDWESAAQLVQQIAESLDYAHEHGVTHRDLKPQNITITADQQPMLSDFSITRIVEEEETHEMTGTNVGLGSPFYMSPEQGKGMQIDYRADIYALGIIFFELVTGHKPFEAGNSMEVVIQQVTVTPPRPRRYEPELPARIEEIILTAMEKDPDERFQSMREMIDAIQQAKENNNSKKQPRQIPTGVWRIITFAAGACAVLVLAGIGIWFALHQNASTSAAQAPSATPQAAALAAPESTLSPTTTSTAAITTPTPVMTETPAPTFTPTMAPFNYAEYPKLAGTRLPSLDRAIISENAAELIEIMRMGQPENHAVVWSPDEKYIYMGTESGIYVFSIGANAPKYMIDAQGAITSLAISPDSSLLAAGGRDGLIQLFEARTGKLLFKITEHTKEITALNFSMDNQFFASASKDFTARVWNASTGAHTVTLSGHGAIINDVEYTPDGSSIITGSDDYSVRLWNAATGAQNAKLDVNGIVNDIDISHDGKMVAAAMNDPRIELWNLETHNRLLSLKESSLLTPVNGVGFSPSSNLIAAAAGDGMLRIFNTINGELLDSFLAGGKSGNPIAVTKAIYAVNGRQILVETADSQIKLMNIAMRKTEVSIIFPAKHYEQIAVSPDGQKLALQDESGITLYSLENGMKSTTLSGWLPDGSPFHTGSEKLAVIRKDGIYLLSTSGSGERLGSFQKDSSVAFTEDGKMLIVAGERKVELWITETGLRGMAGSLKNESNCQSAYTDHGDYIASGLRFLAVNNRTFADFSCPISWDPRTLDSAFASPNTVVFAFNDGTGRLWVNGDANSPKILSGGGGRSSAVAVTSDGSLIALGSANGQIRIYDNEGNEVAIVGHHTKEILDLQFTSDMKKLISLSDDGTIEIWGLLN